ALDYLERSRRRYAALDMPHESAISELELADAYLELNLAPEAAAIYARVTTTFAELGMRAEQARALLNDGRAYLLLGQLAPARTLGRRAPSICRRRQPGRRSAGDAGRSTAGLCRRRL